MGAWNYGVFDDDIAYDALDDLRESLEIITDMEKYFDAVIGAEYVEYGTTDSVIIELQNIGIPRHLSMMIKDDYAEFLTFEDGVLVDINAEALIENIDCDKYKDELEELREIFL